ncbi:uncharacterized protein LOC111611960 isoform X1 [Xiphophorus maculatus]|uniref:uncharacterized protein LOC111611960 isoform X1 n=1 Tax=Xiphophorus maculatus TaxID=8083 RepID=UPI000C6E81C7|nr:uncharacterized protein LOC111611960 isoform X1 [Xiphophorus maculatus]
MARPPLQSDRLQSGGVSTAAVPSGGQGRRLSICEVLDDVSISNTFTHKSLFPEDMDPLSVRGTLSPEGTLWVTVRRTTEASGPEPLGGPTYSSEAHL